MTADWNAWGPPLLVLALGLAAGLVYALRTARDPVEEVDAAREGEKTDREREHEAVVDALKALELEKEKLPEDEYRRQREDLVARGSAALRGLDEETKAPAADPDEARLRAVLAQTGETLSEAEIQAALEAVRKTRAQRKPGLSAEWRGAIWALLLVGLGGVLWWQLSRSAGDRPPEMGAAPMQQQASTADDPDAAPFLARLEQDPNDLEALNALTEIALSHRDLQSAMSTNARALEVAPDDPDAKTHRAALNMAIGMGDRAMTLLEEVLAVEPDHPQALVYKGLFALNQGMADVAVEALERASKGPHGDNPVVQAKLEEARAMAASGGAASEGAASGGPPSGGAASDAAVGGGAAAPIVSGTLALSDDVTVPESAILFVSVRDPAGGPPLAAQKLPVRPFPATFALTTADRLPMGGNRPIPDVVEVSIRVDLDGNATTREDAPSWTGSGVAKGASGVEARLE